jgi:hypothetical protein
MAVNASEIAIAAEINLQHVDGAPSEALTGYPKFLSERPHSFDTNGFAGFRQGLF